MSNCPNKIEFKTSDYTVSYEETPELHKAVFDKVMQYYMKHEAFHGEVIMQDDDCIIYAPETLAIIADEIIKFKVESHS